MQKTEQNASTEKLIKSFNKKQLTKENIQLKLKGNYRDENQDINFSMNVRIKKDSLLWSSVQVFGIEMLRAKLTIDSMKLLNRLEKKYMRGSTHLLGNLMGVNLGPSEVQNLLLGKPLFNLNDYLFETDTAIKASIYKGKIKNVLHINQALTLQESDITSIGLQQSVSGKIEYLKYMHVDDIFCPEHIKMYLISNDKSSQLDLKIQKINTPEQMRFPFKVPNQYQTIDE